MCEIQLAYPKDETTHANTANLNMMATHPIRRPWLSFERVGNGGYVHVKQGQGRGDEEATQAGESMLLIYNGTSESSTWRDIVDAFSHCRTVTRISLSPMPRAGPSRSQRARERRPETEDDDSENNDLQGDGMDVEVDGGDDVSLICSSSRTPRSCASYPSAPREKSP